MNTPKADEILCKRVIGGKKPLWHAFVLDNSGNNIRGAGNTAENAIKDFQSQFRRWKNSIL